MKANPCSEIGGFTRLLSSNDGRLDDLAKDIPTVTAKALDQGGACKDTGENTCDMHFPVMNRPHAVTQLLAKIMHTGVQALSAQETGSAAQLSAKFKNEQDAFTFSFGGLSTFYNGLEGLVGAPNPLLMQTMHHEHCTARDSDNFYEVSNTNVVFKSGSPPATMSLIEWCVLTLAL